MNIFFTALDPDVSANWLCNEHLQKMPLESAQMLSTVAHHLSDKPAEELFEMGIYKPSYEKHTCNIWLRKSLGNCMWLIEHVEGMEARYKRLRKTSKSFDVVRTLKDFLPTLSFPTEKLTIPHLAMLPEYQDIKDKYSTQHDNVWIAHTYRDATLAYREYVRRKVFKPVTKVDRELDRKRLPTWDALYKPEWYTPSCTLVYNPGE